MEAEECEVVGHKHKTKKKKSRKDGEAPIQYDHLKKKSIAASACSIRTFWNRPNFPKEDHSINEPQDHSHYTKHRILHPITNTENGCKPGDYSCISIIRIAKNDGKKKKENHKTLKSFQNLHLPIRIPKTSPIPTHYPSITLAHVRRTLPSFSPSRAPHTLPAPSLDSGFAATRTQNGNLTDAHNQTRMASIRLCVRLRSAPGLATARLSVPPLLRFVLSPSARFFRELAPLHLSLHQLVAAQTLLQNMTPLPLPYWPFFFSRAV
ncbi:hypothetical protein PUMCH_003308 [Australozyma saopauloensis]|uniref:Uncharacterized protein n=1 Tax=Australozyma saopauloensis TaxID=291208 RepID=A0AAX4HC54_9ASCO|nr:hypothetical protein PUMCH_003308 [[Candida] saopauloensis]